MAEDWRNYYDLWFRPKKQLRIPWRKPELFYVEWLDRFRSIPVDWLAEPGKLLLPALVDEGIALVVEQEGREE